jgi:two-component system CheB/CheR fusion protein
MLNDEEGLTRIFSLLREKCKVDFTFYKPSTITRRIERRMAINQTEDIKEYARQLVKNPGEVISLYRELLIGVTSFFRDQEAFTLLQEKYIPDLFNATENREFRFWVAGCSTGEEAYSLAMVARECMEEMGKTFDIKIFATDIDRDAIHFAATGIYPESVAADLSPRLLSKYFFKKDENYQITRSIREMVVFAQHNIIKDPPFTNVSMLSCRNLLIYLQPVLQRKVFEFFNFSLKKNGILMLGTSESTGEMSDFFEPQDTKYKIYLSKGLSKPISDTGHLLKYTDTRARSIREQYAGVRRGLRATEEERVLERFFQTIAEEYLPLSLIVNEHMEVLHTIGDPNQYLKVPSGKLVNDISRMAIKELSVPLSTGIQKVFRTHQEIRISNIRLRNSTNHTLIDLRILPMWQKKGNEDLVVVIIGETKKADILDKTQNIQSYDLTKEAEEHLHHLEQDLQFTRENLQATIEELETSNEELQATNEELLASNEELQSTNEELQSTNEELFTVNAEYQSKIIELTELYNDVENILSIAQVSLILLDENLEVKRYSPNITKIFSLLSNDIGRPITHISHFIKDLDPIKVLSQVQSSNTSSENEICTEDGRVYLMRVEPYVIGPKSYSGIVASFIDITEQKTSKSALETSEDRFFNLFETMDLGVVYQDADGLIISANPSAENILGLSIEQMQGKKSVDPHWKSVHEDGSPFPGEEHPSMIALKTGEKVNDVIMGVFNPVKKGTTWINVSAVPMFNKGEKMPFQVYATFQDITGRKQAQLDLVKNEEQYRMLFSEINSGIAVHEMIFDDNDKAVDYRFLKVNTAFEEQTGLKAADIIGKTVLEVIPNLEDIWIKRYGDVVITGEPVSFTQYSKEFEKYFEVRAIRLSRGQFAVIFHDITEYKNQD